jgi:hypothetical protein
MSCIWRARSVAQNAAGERVKGGGYFLGKGCSGLEVADLLRCGQTGISDRSAESPEKADVV